MSVDYERLLVDRMKLVRSFCGSMPKPPSQTSKLGSQISELDAFAAELSKLPVRIAELAERRARTRIDIDALKTQARDLQTATHQKSDKHDRVLELLAKNRENQGRLDRAWKGSEADWAQQRKLQAEHLKLELDLLELETLAQERSAQAKRAAAKKIRNELIAYLQLEEDLEHTQRRLNAMRSEVYERYDLAGSVLNIVRDRHDQQKQDAERAQRKAAAKAAAEAQAEAERNAVKTSRDGVSAQNDTETNPRFEVDPGLAYLMQEAGMNPEDPAEVAKYRECFTAEDIEAAAELARLEQSAAA